MPKNKEIVGTKEIVTTLLGTITELESFVPVDFVAHTNNTLNFKHNVARDVLPKGKPKCLYYSMGIGGVRNKDSGNGRMVVSPKATNQDLYTPIPFRMVPEDEDLSEVERNKYRLRTLTDIPGVGKFWSYWLKLIDYKHTAVQITTTQPNSNIEKPYELDNTNLNPEPPTLATTGSTSADRRINVTVTGEITLRGSEVLEAVNAIYQDPTRAIVSEIGIVSGEEQTVQGPDGKGGTISYTEAVYTMLHSHICFLGSDCSSPDTIMTRLIRMGKGNLVLL